MFILPGSFSGGFHLLLSLFGKEHRLNIIVLGVPIKEKPTQEKQAATKQDQPADEDQPVEAFACQCVKNGVFHQFPSVNSSGTWDAQQQNG